MWTITDDYVDVTMDGRWSEVERKFTWWTDDVVDMRIVFPNAYQADMFSATLNDICHTLAKHDLTKERVDKHNMDESGVYAAICELMGGRAQAVTYMNADERRFSIEHLVGEVRHRSSHRIPS